MNKKRKFLFVALLSIFTTAGVLAACSADKNITEIPSDKDYGFTNPEVQHMPPDEGFNIDGVLDEYDGNTWISLTNDNGTSTVNLSMTSHYGEKGMYFAYDVTENTPIYVNPDRASYINSGIEMYLAPNGVTSMSNENIFEIDLEADGSLTFKRNNGFSGQWAEVPTTPDIMAYLAAQPKGGAVNTAECYGYTLEFFIPWDYLEWLGLNTDSIKEEAVYVNPVHITSFNYEGKDYSRDRYWYSFATQLGGDGWNNVNQYFKFDKDGAVGTVPVTLEQGAHCTVSGPAAVMPGLPATVTVTPESGYAITSFKCNNEERIKYVSYNKDGSVTYTVSGEDGGLTFSAEAEAVTDGNKNLTGVVNLKKAGGDTYMGLVASYIDARGEHELTINGDGTFALNDLAQGYYTVCVEKNGYGTVKRGVYLNRNTDIVIDLEYGTFDVVEGTCWDISHANEGYVNKIGGRGAILSKNSYDTFYVEANFRYDESLASVSSIDEYYQQRMGFRIKFSGGKYWHPDVMCEDGVFKVTYGKILNNDSLFNWDTVHVMNSNQIAKYKSKEGIKLGVLREGTIAYIYLDDELVATTDFSKLGQDGVKADETAQIGFEGFVYNSEVWQIKYRIDESKAGTVDLNVVNAVGAEVQLADEYKLGEDAILVLTKQNPDDVLLSLIVNGEELSGGVKADGSREVLTLANNTSRTLNVEVVYGKAEQVTANILVDSAWRANGIKFTFINAANNTIVKEGTVQDNKITIPDMTTGRWKVLAEVFGARVELGDYSVVSSADKLLDVDKIFVNGKALDPSVIDLSNGNFIYHSTINENYSININNKGDAYLAAKVSLPAQYKQTFLKNGEVSFGMYVTVMDADGKETTHWVDFWLKNAGADDLLTLRTDFNWAENLCVPLSTQIDSNKYSNALFGNGLYVVLRYNSQTGFMETFLGTADYNVVYLRTWQGGKDTDESGKEIDGTEAGKFPVSGTVTKIGFRDNLDWGGTSVAVNIENFRYGATLLEALGVSGKTINVVGAGEQTYGTITAPQNVECGKDIAVTVTPKENYMITAITVNGVSIPVESFDGMTVTFKNCTAATLNVEVTFAQIKKAETVTLDITGKKYGVSGNAAEGATVSLAYGKYAYSGVVENGKVTFNNVVVYDSYTLTVEGFFPVENVNVTESGVADNSFNVEFDVFKNYPTEYWNWGQDTAPDLTEQNDNKITQNDASLWVVSNETFDSVAITASVKKGGETGLFVKFGNDYVIAYYNEGEKAITWNNGTAYHDYWSQDINNITGSWDKIKPITADLEKDLTDGTLNITLVRKGGNIYAYVNGEYCAMRSYGGKKTAKCQVGIYSNGSSRGVVRTFDIKQGAVTVNNATADTNGTVVITPDVKIGDTVAVTVTPDENYVISSVTVTYGSGKTVKVTKTDENVFEFVAAEKEYSVVAVFQEITTLDTVVFTADSVWNANGLEVTLSRQGYEDITGTVTGNKLTVNNVMVGEWTVNAQVYGAPVSFKVNVTGRELNLDFGNIFANADYAKGNVNLATGSVTYHGTEDIGVNTNVTGDAWFVGKVIADRTVLDNGGQVPFALSITFDDGKFKYVGINISNNGNDKHLCLNDGHWIDPNSHWWEDGHKWGDTDVCDTKLGSCNHSGSITLSKYGEALFGSGLYYIVKYDASTGYLSVYYATSSGDLILAKVMGNNDCAVKNGTIVKFGINRGIGWGNTQQTFEVSNFRYGATLAEAWELAGAVNVVNPTVSNGTVTVENSGNAKHGDTVKITVTPDAGYVCTSFKLNGTEIKLNGANGFDHFVMGDITIEAVFGEVIEPAVPHSIVTDNTADIDLDAKVGDMDSIAYQAFSGEGALHTKDPLRLLDISEATKHYNGYAGDFKEHNNYTSWTVTAEGLAKGTAHCINGNFDMQVKAVKGLQQIRLFVGGWWMNNHGGVFTLTSKDGTQYYGEVTYTSSNDNANDIIVFNIDTTGWAENEERELVLNFDGTGYGQLPFAGVQLLGNIGGTGESG